ncbi:MAG: SIS domain-containing protein [Candidatus Bathyarchaeia archaeon]
MSRLSFPHYMLEEIYSEPRAMRATLSKAGHCIDHFIEKFNLSKIKFLYITGSGTSYHAGLASQYIFSTIAKIPVSTIQASEFPKWTPQTFDKGTWLIAISQSGESIDVLNAVNEATRRGGRVLGVTNTSPSSLANTSDITLLTDAGVELAVTATKTFSSQLAALFLLSLRIAKSQGVNVESLLEGLFGIPQIVEKELESLDRRVLEVAKRFKDKNFYFLLGSGPNFAIALEGALKMKEASNVFAEGFATREFLHGPQQLVNELTPLITISPRKERESIVSLIDRFRGFNAPIITVSHEGVFDCWEGVYPIALKGEVEPILTPLLYIVPLQLYAYHSAVLRGYNPDKPERLEKVVK